MCHSACLYSSIQASSATAALWKGRPKGKQFWASPVIADGKLYVVSKDGFTSVFKLGDKPELVATNPLGETILATPAIAGGHLYMRSDQHLFCIGATRID